MTLKTQSDIGYANRAAISALLRLLHSLGVKSADPYACYGGSMKRYNTIMGMLMAGIISKDEARTMLGFPLNKFL